ncbi:hypothetical protein PHYPSEUDO_011661 [Phytophthora pseudosyringae]|uniref:Uncharacterized protein n=1 Tax=Phytophthora pseudosyringae TaxID=221518 RepID=A0A8T1W5I6_9STRA|nr:hypothetical protein PHYPSEUDO_011661 [Phytophthora pseudosyringae]
MGVCGILAAKAKAGVEVVLLLDKRQALAPYELPRIREFLDAGVTTYLVVVDDIICSTGSCNPSMMGLHESYENLTYHFNAEETDKAKRQILFQRDDDCELVTSIWLDEMEAKLTAEKKAGLRP